jgi:ubiquinone/menaquinone biosynthesis C-methylase UbiE
MSHSVRNRLLVRLGAPDRYIQGASWQDAIQCMYRGMPHYDLIIDRVFPDYKRAATDLLDALVVSADHRLLDLGCGTGVVTLPAAHRSRFAVGIDLTAAMLDRQRRKLRGHTERTPALIRGDVRFLPLADHSFDRVTTSFMLLHLTEREKKQVFGEVARVLVADGRFGCLTGMHEIARVYPTPAQWRRWLCAGGFTEIQIQECYGAFRIVTATRREAHEIAS